MSALDERSNAVNGYAANVASGDRSSAMITPEQLADLSETFESIDINGDGVIQLSELQLALKTVGLDLPGYEVRQLIERYNRRGSGDSLSFWEFNQLYKELKEKKDFGRSWKKQVKEAADVNRIEGQSDASQAQEIFHTVRIEEQVAFSDWINSNLGEDSDLRKVLPVSTSGADLYQKVGDGLVLCKLINLAVPETIDERAINKRNLNAYTKRENLTLAINSASAIGCNIVNIDADDLAKGRPHLVLGLLWQIIRIGLFNLIDLVHVPELARLLREGETLADLQRLSPEQILIRWVNYHLENAGVDRRLNNFTTDVQDSEIYSYLLNQIAPKDRGVTLEPLMVRGDNVRRAEAMLKEADKLDCRSFVTAQDVANGVYKLNLAFVANLFNTWSGLKPLDAQEFDELEGLEESREEKTYRNWMNSMGVTPYVNWLYSDLSNGVIIFQLYDIISPGIVEWKKVVTKFKKLSGMMDQIENCNYAVKLGRRLKFSLVGIQGKDIYDGNRTLTLALVWQLMRAYTLTVLTQCVVAKDGKLPDSTAALKLQEAAETEIREWVNQKLRHSGKDSQIKSFQDSRISDAKVFIDLIDAIQPGVINFDLIRDGHTTEDKLANAKYAVTVARKIGAKVYALPEDIVEVKPKMVMTVFACLMARDYCPNMREAPSPTYPLDTNE